MVLSTLPLIMLLCPRKKRKSADFIQRFYRTCCISVHMQHKCRSRLLQQHCMMYDGPNLPMILILKKTIAKFYAFLPNKTGDTQYAANCKLCCNYAATWAFLHAIGTVFNILSNTNTIFYIKSKKIRAQIS